MAVRTWMSCLVFLAACGADVPVGPDQTVLIDALTDVGSSDTTNDASLDVHDVPVDLCAAVTCDDGNACTADSCAGGLCQHAALVGPCSDLNPCTSGDVCQADICLPGAVTICTDGIACTADSCNPKSGCVFTPDASQCDDAKPCTQDSCTATGCTHGKSPSGCDDGDLCTADTCKSALCVHTPSTAACNDNNACTDDLCEGTCKHVNNQAKCTDANTCTTTDFCAAGVCVGGAPLICNDGKPCTADSCVPATGCAHAAIVDVCGNGKCGCGETVAVCPADCK